MLDRNQDSPPKDTSEEEIDEWNASEVPVMEHTVECGSRFQLPGQGVQGLLLSGALNCLSRESDSPEFGCDYEMFKTNCRLFETDCPRSKPIVGCVDIESRSKLILCWKEIGCVEIVRKKLEDSALETDSAFETRISFEGKFRVRNKQT